MMDFLNKIAPWLSAAVGGPPALLAMAAKEISGALGYDVPADKAKITTAVAGANQEQLVKLKELESSFQIKMQELGFDHVQVLEQLAVNDRISARNREMTVKDHIPAVLAVGVTVGYFSVLGYMLNAGVPANGGEALLVMLGALGTAWGSIIAYYYGSSSGSARKTELMGSK
jgi:hypothetical protein